MAPSVFMWFFFLTQIFRWTHYVSVHQCNGWRGKLEASTSKRNEDLLADGRKELWEWSRWFYWSLSQLINPFVFEAPWKEQKSEAYRIPWWTILYGVIQFGVVLCQLAVAHGGSSEKLNFLKRWKLEQRCPTWGTVGNPLVHPTFYNHHKLQYMSSWLHLAWWARY